MTPTARATYRPDRRGTPRTFEERRYPFNVDYQCTHRSSHLDTDEEGQGLAEYALILALIAIVAIVALIFLGGQVSTILSTVGNSV